MSDLIPDRAIARVLAGGLGDWRDLSDTITEPFTTQRGHNYQQAARVQIDLNVRLGRTRTFSAFRHCDRIPAVGEPVVVYEPEAGIEGPAVCSGIDEDKQLVYLDVDWPGLRGS